MKSVSMPASFPGLPEDWEERTKTVKMSDGTELFLNEWRKKNVTSTSPQALLVLHGHGEHSGRYGHFPHYFQNDIDVIFAYDHRGHGRSTGIRGHAPEFDSLVEDCDEILTQLRAQAPTIGLHLLGHSMGGLVALRVLLKWGEKDWKFKTAQVSAPLLGIKVPVPPLKRLGATLLERVFGSLKLETALNPEFLSHDPAAVKTYRNDRLVHDYMTPQFFMSLLRTLKEMEGLAPRFDMPIQFLLPGDDKIVDSDVARGFADRSQAKKKEVIDYPGFYHEIFNEVEKDKPLHAAVAWVRG